MGFHVLPCTLAFCFPGNGQQLAGMAGGVSSLPPRMRASSFTPRRPPAPAPPPTSARQRPVLH